MDGASVRGDENGIPVFVMLPEGILNGQNNGVDYVSILPPLVAVDARYDNLKTAEKELLADLDSLKKVKVRGVMVDCWWGIVEAERPGQYNWDGYKKLFSVVRTANLELHVVMSFHACGGNVGDSVNIPLPNWVKSIGEEKDLFYKDAHDNPSIEYLSWAVDQRPVLKDQYGHRVSPLQVYENFMLEFRKNMSEFLHETITVIEVGLGPSGELRYPAYRLPWEFKGTDTGVGEFQCYDKYMMESWKNEAEEGGFTIPCCVGPQTAGNYTSTPEETQFFQTGAGLTNGICYSETYGKTFLTWYSKNLVDHARMVLEIANKIFKPRGVQIAAKVPGIHWWDGKPSHAAEATAGLFAGDPQNSLFVYESIAKTLESLETATFIFTCAEMKDDPSNEDDRPQTLVKQVLGVAKKFVPRACENALEVTDEKAYDQIRSVAADNNISYFTYMRLGPAIMKDKGAFDKFVEKMNEITRS